MEWLSGKKTYLVALSLGIVTAAEFLGYLDHATATILVQLLIGGGLATLRAALPVVANPDEQPSRPNNSSAASLSLLVICCGLASPAVAESPRVQIVGPNSVQAGELCELEAAEAEQATHISWRVFPEVVGRRQLVVSHDDRHAVISTLPGTYWVLCVASNADGHAVATHTVTVPGVGPAPPSPGPIPGPNPRPPSPAPAPVDPEATLPAGEFGLAKDAYRAAMTIQSPNRAAEAQDLARSAGALASEIAAGAVVDPQAIANRMAEAIAAKGAAWKDFSKSVGKKLQGFYLGGRLNEPADWATALREAQTGLAAVR